MNALWVLAVVIGVVAGDVGLGYHYKVPHTSYGVPTYQSSSSSASYNPSFAGSSSSNNYNSLYNNNAGASSNYYSGQSSQEQLSSGIGHTIGYQPGYQTLGSSSGAGLNSNYYQTSSSGFVQPSYQSGVDYSSLNQYQTSSQYQTTAAEKYQQYYNVVQQPAQVYKHYYVHAAPEEPENTKPRQPIVLPPPQKHYKIIFIKAPTSPAQAPQIIPVQQQNEEKTIVYVLVKKPEEAQDIVLPKIEQKPPSKPEVYFIKYNNKQDSQAVINNIVTDFNKGGNSESGYNGASDASSGSGQVYQQGLGQQENQGSSTFDSSSLGTVSASGESGNYGSAFGSSSGVYGSSSNAFGSYDGAKVQSVSIAGVDNGAADSGYDSSSGSSVYHGSSGSSGYGTSSGSSGYDSSSLSSVSSTASTLTGFDASAISTSQGVPHETYGPPKFKVL